MIPFLRLPPGFIELPGERMTSNWYKEIDHYDWGHPGFGMKTGHFTQMIWKNSRRIGIGGAKYVKAQGELLPVYISFYKTIIELHLRAL